MLALSGRAFDGVADQERARTIGRNAQLQAAIQRELVGLRLWLVSVDGSKHLLTFLFSGLYRCQSGASFLPDGVELLGTYGVVLALHTPTGVVAFNRGTSHSLCCRVLVPNPVARQSLPLRN